MTLKREGIQSTIIRFLILANTRIPRPLPFPAMVRNLVTTEKKRKIIRKKSERLSYRPKFTLIVPDAGSGRHDCLKTVNSVLMQLYPFREVCIISGDPTAPIDPLCPAEMKNEDNILISQADSINSAMEQCSGDYIGILQPGDELIPTALYHLARDMQVTCPADLIYGDDLEADAKGEAVFANFKPDFSLDYLLSYPFIGNCFFARRNLFLNLWNRKKSEVTDSCDLLLRLISLSGNIVHIPHVISIQKSNHILKRQLEMSISRSRAVQEFLKREQIDAEVFTTEDDSVFRVKRRIQGKPSVTIIIPTKDRTDLLSKCISSIMSISTYDMYDVLIVDNGSRDQKTAEYFDMIEKNPGIRVVRYPEKFNFSALNNFAAGQAHGEYLIFLNNDVEVISPGWIEALLEHSQRKEVACVGAKLLYPDGTIQHAGVIVGLSGIADPIYKSCPGISSGYMHNLVSIRNYSALTAACMMIRKDLFMELGGFDEQFRVGFGDVDICMRAIQNGYSNIFTPYALLYHHESASRGQSIAVDPHPRDTLLFLLRWHSWLRRGDPFYNRNLPLDTFDLDPYVKRGREYS
jgi:GT2 family glycosyltransferase